MDKFKLAIIIYVSGIVFNLAVIAYLNERKETKIPEGLAVMSWFSLATLTCITICWIGEIILRIVYYGFCRIFREKT